MLTARLSGLRDLIGEAYGVYNADMSWEGKYRIIFSEAVYDRIDKALTRLGLAVTYTTHTLMDYREKVTSYIEALEELERDIGVLYGPEGDYTSGSIDGRDYSHGPVWSESSE
jgi:hypothetical protein